MFTLPDDLREYAPEQPVLYYLHVNNAETNNSRLHFSRPCISIGINGNKTIQSPKGIERFGPGDLIFYTPGNYLSYQNIDTDGPYKSLMIFFDPLVLSYLLRQIGDKQEVGSSKLDGAYYQSLRANSYISNFGRSIMQLLSEEQEFSSSLQKLKLLELVVYLKGIFGDFIGDDIRHPREMSDYQLQKIIEDSSNGNLTLEEIAFMCNMSLATFKRVFNRVYGTSPGKWLRDRKLTWAEEQIRKFHRLPKEVYDQAGYRDYASFSFAFKQKFGTSPSQIHTAKLSHSTI